MIGWYRKHKERLEEVGCVLGLLAFFGAVLNCCGFGVWDFFIGEPRKERQKKEEARARQEKRRQQRYQQAGTTFDALPGQVDRIGFEDLAAALVPDEERQPWQPEGVVAILGSHRARHWTYGEAITCVCGSHDGKWVYSGGGDGQVRVWEPASLREQTSLVCPEGGVLGVAASADGRWLAACGGVYTEGWVRVWKVLPTGFEECATFVWEESGVTSVAFSPDGRRLAAGGGKSSLFDTSSPLASSDHHGWVQLWDVEADDSKPGATDTTGWVWWRNALLVAGCVLAAVALLTPGVHAGGRKDAGATPPERPRWVALMKPEPPSSGSHEETKVRLWDRACWVHWWRYRTPPGGRWCPPLVILALAAVVLLASAAVVWLCAPSSEPAAVKDFYTLTSPGEAVWALAFSPDSRLLAAGSDDGAVRLWNLEGADTTRWVWWTRGLLGAGCVLAVTALLWPSATPERPSWVSLQVQRVVSALSGSQEGKVRMWGRDCCVVAAVGLLASAAVVWWCGPGFTWPCATGQHSEMIGAVAFSPDGKALATGDLRGTIKLWRVAGGRLEATRTTHDGVAVQSLAFSADGRTLFAGRRHARAEKPVPPAEKSSALRAYSLADGGLAATNDLLEANADVRGVTISPDGKRLVAACADEAAFADFRAADRDTLHGLGGAFLRPRLRVWDLSGLVPRESTPGGEPPQHVAEIRPNSPVLITAEGSRRTAWQVSGGRLTRHAQVDLGGGPIWWLSWVMSFDGRAFFDAVTHEARDRKEPETGVPFLDADAASIERGYPVTLSLIDLSGREPMAAAAGTGSAHLIAQAAAAAQMLASAGAPLGPIAHLLAASRVAESDAFTLGRGPKVAHTDRYLFESGYFGWRLEVYPPRMARVFAPDGKAAAWCVDGKRVLVWDLSGKDFCRRCELTVPEGKVSDLALSPGLRLAAVTTEKKELHLWDLSENPPRHGRLDLPGDSDHWVTFLGDDRTLVTVDAKEKITLWDLSGPEPMLKFSGTTLEELDPPDRALLGERVRRHPAGAFLPDEWRAAFLPWTHRLRAARVTEAGVTVTREERDGKKTMILEWSPPGDVVRTRFSGDGRHLVVTYGNGTVEVVRLDPDGRLLGACDAVLAREPDDVPALVERSRVRLRRGELHLALEDAERAMSKDAGSVEGWRLRGLAYARRGDHRIAEQCFTALLKLRPQDAAALHRRGLSRAQHGDHAGARQDFAAALKIDPELARRPAR